jgi:hypothetical protein
VSYAELTQGDPRSTDVTLQPIMTIDSYNHLRKKKKIEVINRACYGTPAMIAYHSLPTRFKERVVAKYGDPEQTFSKYMLRDRIIKDLKAEYFYQRYTFDDKGIEHLKPQYQKEYTMNASVLNVLPAFYDERVKFIKTRSHGGTRRVWPEICTDLANIQKEVGCNLPKNPVALKRKMEEYQAGGYEVLVSKKFRNINAKKAKSEDQESLLRELIGSGQNINNESVANLYNLIASRMGWESITGATVGNYKWRMPEAFPGQHGTTEFFNKKAMQIKRSKPTSPLFFWCIDGWDTELLYKDKRTGKNGHSVTTYHNRPTTVVILDPFNNYIIGYAIGDHETPALIRQAMRNAYEHVYELFGAYYKPWQIQTDNYGGKELKSFFEKCTYYYTPARVKNAKAKIVEPFFNWFNNQYLRIFKNSSGYGVKSSKMLQPSDDFINQHKHEFPDRLGCVAQIEEAINKDRKLKHKDYVDRWNKVDKSDHLPFYRSDFLFLFGETTRPHKLHGHGITLQVDGEKYVYDCFYPEFRTYGHRSFILRYDPANLDNILAIENTGTIESPVEGGACFMLEQKYVQPMALKDRKPGDYEQLQRTNDYNKELVNDYIAKRSRSGEVVRDFFSENAGDLNDTLTKFMITNSLGQHKDVRNEVAGRKSRQALPEATPVTVESFDVVMNERDFLNDF